ncbi:MAG TPA: C40 family peptidase [Longimicrobiales bacterium]
MARHVETGALVPSSFVLPATPAATAADPGIDPVASQDSGTAVETVFVGERMVDVAVSLVGTRYRWGGVSPSQGFDCSGFVRYVYAQQGIDLPRVSRAQARAGRRRPARLDELQPGDLLFFAQRGAGVDHVAIYAGDGRIVHASRRGYGVRYDDLSGASGRWYAERLVAVRRILEDAPAPATVDPAPAVPLGEAVAPLIAADPVVATAEPAL